MNYKETKKGQILVITLLVLMVLAIGIIGVTLLLNRDTQQVSSSAKYQQIFNVAESEIQNVVVKYGDPDEDITQIQSDLQSCEPANQANEIGYNCDIDSSDVTELNVQTSLSLADRKIIEEWEIRKDQNFTVNLDGYTSGLRFVWDKDAALEFALTYFVDTNGNNVWDSNEQMHTLRDYYDMGSTQIYDTIYSGDPYSNSKFNYNIIDASNLETTTSFNVGTVDGLPANAYPYTLAITPRQRNAINFESVLVTIEPTDYISFPYQVREFYTTSFDIEDEATPVVTVTSRIPLLRQVDTVFDYSLLTNNNVSL